MWNQESERNIMLVGHRGIRALYPENTILSFQKALEMRFDLIEFDVHFTRDKVLVVCHDATIDRTTNRTGAIRDMTLEELSQVDAGVRKGAEFAGQCIPTLREVLTLMASAPYEVLLNVEIKDYDHEVIDATIAMLREFGMDQRAVIACFNAEVIAYIQEAHPDMRTQGFPQRIMERTTPAGFQFTEAFFDRMFGMGIPVAHGDMALIRSDVAFARAHDIRPWLFCTDDRESAVRAVEAGATNITCNYPYPAIEYLIEKGLHAPVPLPRMVHKPVLAPSMMCADVWQNGKQTLDALLASRVGLLHADVMDGSFVSNLMMGTDAIKQLRRASSVPLDIHLMIEEPERKLDWFDIQPGEYVSIHAESTRHLQRVLARIRELGAHPMVALNPATPISVIEEVIPDIDGVTVMTVNPGFAGQKLVPQTLQKITRVRRLLDAANRQDAVIEVDGNVSFENAVKMRRAGADIFVCGSSSIFSAEGTLEENIARIRADLENVEPEL